MWDLCKFDANIALIAENGLTMKYKELNEEAEKLAGVIGERCLLFSFCENSVGSILGYVTALNHRFVPVLLNAHLDSVLRDELILRYLPKYLWMPTTVWQKMSHEDDICKENGFDSLYSAFGYELIKTNFAKEYELYPDLALLLTTSGSTGSPKFVRQSYENIKANTASIIEYLSITESEKAITTLPMNYTYGLSIINTHLMAGATLLLTDKGLMQKEFWSFFKGHGATSFGGVPYTYEMLDRLRFYRMDLPTLSYMTQAGGKITPELHKKLAEFALETGKKFIVMYGQCEATARMGYLPAEKSLEKCGSMGVAIPGGNFHLVDVNGNEIESPNVTGELVYDGPNVTLGYAESGEDLIKGDERNGILQTGDMALFDEDGYYYIVGRKKRFLKIYGNRVNLDEIDRMIKAQFDNIDVASAGVDDHLYIFVTDESYAEKARDFVVEKTGLNHVAFKSIVIDEIPKNDSGKVLYKELAKYYSE